MLLQEHDLHGAEFGGFFMDNKNDGFLSSQRKEVSMKKGFVTY